MSRVLWVTLLLSAVTPALPAPAACRTTITGGLVEEEHWTAANSPYCLRGSIQVSLLTIDPGVEVLADGDFEIEVLSTITAIGTVDAPIRFGVRTPGQCWLGLRFEYTQPGSVFRHCMIEDSHRSGISITGGVPPTLESVVFRNNASQATGGAIDSHWLDADLEVRSCYFTGNTAIQFGGAIYAHLPAGRAVWISDSEFVGNSVQPPYSSASAIGGAVSVLTGDAVISKSRFDSNKCVSRGSLAAEGGALLVQGNGTVTIDNSVFVNNSVAGDYPYGGAAYLGAGPVAIRNSVFACNSISNAPYSGGAGIYVGGGTVSVVNSIFARNIGGAAAETHPAASLAISSSILFFNGSQVAGPASVEYSDVQGGFNGAGNLDVNPVFAGTGCHESDLVIIAGSPCIDAGDPAPSNDDSCFPPSRGQTRNDIGAHGGPGGCGWVPYEIRDVRFTSDDDLTWTRSRIATAYSLYRGTMNGSGWHYDHACQVANLPTASARDTETPTVGYYYFVTAWNANGESTPGIAVEPRIRCDGTVATTLTPRPRINSCSHD